MIPLLQLHCDHECVCWWYYEHKKSGSAAPCESTKCHHRFRIPYQNERELIKPGDRRTCEYQEIETYPADEYVYCTSPEKCEFQCPSRADEKIYCDKKVISYDAAIEQAARKDEREKLLDELIKYYEQVIIDGKGVTYNHPITYQWMYQGVVVDYLKELRQNGGEL
jgi:hypothetical protein